MNSWLEHRTERGAQPGASSLQPEVLHEFWFGDVLIDPGQLETQQQIWFGSGASLDAAIRNRFASWLNPEYAELRNSWIAKPENALSLVLLYDQVPRNAFRGDPRAFAWDPQALALTRQIDPSDFHPLEQMFLALPFEHSENLEDQREAMARFRRLNREATPALKDFMEMAENYALMHFEAIGRFGRFPHRNAILGRESTPAERAYLADPKSFQG